MRRTVRIFIVLIAIAGSLAGLRQRTEAAGTNLALSGTGYRWYGLSGSTANTNKTAATGINDNNLTTDVPLTGNSNTDDFIGAYEAAGVIWSSPQNMNQVKYVNGSFDVNSNGVFTCCFQLQFTQDGSTWAASGWGFSPSYAYDTSAAGGVTYTFSGSATNVLGLRAVGQVHASDNSNSWHATAREVQAFGPSATNTPVPPTNTPTDTPTSQPTSQPPTNTPIPSPTLTATSTPTQLQPPTNTPIVTPTVTATGVVATPTIPPDSANTFVRINQVGYISGEPKTAILLAPAATTGTFKVVSPTTGSVIFSGPIPSTSKGSWSTTFPDTYILDFSSANAAGTYYIQITGSRTAHSPKFKIDIAANVYQKLVSNGLFYYQAQRDGPNVISSVMNRKASHLNDQSATVYGNPSFSTDGNDTLLSDLTKIGGPVDASGGWFDAGDFLKFVYTSSYTNALMLFSVRERSAILGSGGSINFVGEAQFGTDWLQKMWNGSTRTLYYQVGLGSGNSTIEGDHDLWRLPEVDDTMAATSNPTNKYLIHRPVFRANTPGGPISPNMAGRVAASFGLCYQVFQQTNPTYADACLVSAEQIYDLSNTSNPGSTMLTTSPHDFYPSDETWHSDMEFGAVELYNALHVAGGSLPSGLSHTDPNYYLTQGAAWAHASLSDVQDSLNLYHVDGLADYELYNAIGQSGASGLAVTQSDLLNRIKSHITSAISGASSDPFGQGFTANDITPHDLGLAVEAHFYDTLTGTTTYRAFEMSRLDWVLGKNAWGSSFIVGAGTTFPFCMQHEVANLSGSLNGSSPIVLGSTTDGPNTAQTGLSLQTGMRACPTDGVDHFKAFNAHSLVYVDNVISWPTSEPANDYTIIGVVAFTLQLP